MLIWSCTLLASLFEDRLRQVDGTGPPLYHITSSSFLSMVSSSLQWTSYRLMNFRFGAWNGLLFQKAFPSLPNGKRLPCQGLVRPRCDTSSASIRATLYSFAFLQLYRALAVCKVPRPGCFRRIHLLLRRSHQKAQIFRTILLGSPLGANVEE